MDDCSLRRRVKDSIASQTVAPVYSGLGFLGKVDLRRRRAIQGNGADCRASARCLAHAGARRVQNHRDGLRRRERPVHRKSLSKFQHELTD